MFVSINQSINQSIETHYIAPFVASDAEACYCTQYVFKHYERILNSNEFWMEGVTHCNK